MAFSKRFLAAALLLALVTAPLWAIEFADEQADNVFYLDCSVSNANCCSVVQSMTVSYGGFIGVLGGYHNCRCLLGDNTSVEAVSYPNGFVKRCVCTNIQEYDIVTGTPPICQPMVPDYLQIALAVAIFFVFTFIALASIESKAKVSPDVRILAFILSVAIIAITIVFAPGGALSARTPYQWWLIPPVLAAVLLYTLVQGKLDAWLDEYVIKIR